MLTEQCKFYQGKNGAIYILIGNCYTALTENQINDLRICVYDIDDFSLEDYQRYYGKKEK